MYRATLTNKVFFQGIHDTLSQRFQVSLLPENSFLIKCLTAYQKDLDSKGFLTHPIALPLNGREENLIIRCKENGGCILEILKPKADGEEEELLIRAAYSMEGIPIFGWAQSQIKEPNKVISAFIQKFAWPNQVAGVIQADNTIQYGTPAKNY